MDQHFNDVMTWSQDIAYMPAWGNHEWATAADGMADNLNNYEGRFDFPNSQTSPGATDAVGNGPGEDWYWFDYGNVRFISFPEPMTGAWEDWVNSVQPAMAAAQSDPSIQFIIAYGHRPAWSSGADHSGDTQLAGYFATLHGKYSKFNLVIQGHSTPKTTSKIPKVMRKRCIAFSAETLRRRGFPSPPNRVNPNRRESVETRLFRERLPGSP